MSRRLLPINLDRRTSANRTYARCATGISSFSTPPRGWNGILLPIAVSPVSVSFQPPPRVRNRGSPATWARTRRTARTPGDADLVDGWEPWRRPQRRGRVLAGLRVDLIASAVGQRPGSQRAVAWIQATGMSFGDTGIRGGFVTDRSGLLRRPTMGWSRRGIGSHST